LLIQELKGQKEEMSHQISDLQDELDTLREDHGEMRNTFLNHMEQY